MADTPGRRRKLRYRVMATASLAFAVMTGLAGLGGLAPAAFARQPTSVGDAVPHGRFSITKRVTGETAGYVPGSRFTVSYDCGDGASGALQIVDGATESVGSFPAGTVCHLSETAKPPTADASYAYGPESWDASDTVTITDEDQVVAVVLTNPIERVLGGFTVTKKVTGETAGYVPGSTFTVGYDCGAEGNGIITLTDGATAAVGDLPVGSTCRLSETAQPPTTDASYAYGPGSWDPSDTVTVPDDGEGNTEAVVLTNTIERVVGGFTVTKKVTGDTAGYVPASTFTVAYTCTSGASGTLTLADGQSATVKDLAVGTSCTLAETAKPATTGSAFTWGTETWSPSDRVIIAADGSANLVAVTLTNPVKGEVAVLGTTATPAELPRTGRARPLAAGHGRRPADRGRRLLRGREPGRGLTRAEGRSRPVRAGSGAD